MIKAEHHCQNVLCLQSTCYNVNTSRARKLKSKAKRQMEAREAQIFSLWKVQRLHPNVSFHLKKSKDTTRNVQIGREVYESCVHKHSNKQYALMTAFVFVVVFGWSKNFSLCIQTRAKQLKSYFKRSFKHYLIAAKCRHAGRHMHKESNTQA